jgi:nucleoside diphosphate kinase
VKTARQMLGETDPVSKLIYNVKKIPKWLNIVARKSKCALLFYQAKSLPGTIRGDYCIDIGRLVFDNLLVIWVLC